MKTENKKVVRQMPYSIETEQAVLGSILVSENAANYVCSAFKENAFYSLSHKKIFSAMKKLYSQNSPVDYVTVVSELEKEGALEEAGGIGYITTLTNIVPSGANYTHYCEILKRDLVLRELINAGEHIIQMAYETDNMNAALKFAEKLIFEISEKQSISDLEHIEFSSKAAIDKFHIINDDKDALRGVTSGLHALDKYTNGFQKGDLVLLAARPAVGKTSLGMNIVCNAALKGKAKVAVFSLEMPKIQIAQRCLCSHASVSMEKALKGEMNQDEWNRLWQAHTDLKASGIYVDDSSLNTPMDILSKCRKLKREHGLDLVMIDYLQLMTSKDSGKDANRQQQVADMTRMLKIAAKELDVPIILLSQLSRASEQRGGDHKPMLSDLRESGAIEQDADIVMFIHNPDAYEKDEAKKQGIRELIIAKHRNGPIGEVKLKFIGETTTFVNLTKDADDQSLERQMPNYDKTRPVDAPKTITSINDSDIGDIF